MEAHEARLVSKFDNAFEILFGVYYEKIERTVDINMFWGGDDSENPFIDSLVPGGIWAPRSDQDYTQLAFFGEASYQFDDRWELTLGGRYFDYEREDVQTNKLAELEAGLIQWLWMHPKRVIS